MTYSLNTKNLNQLPASVIVPAYNRENVTAGILHIGVGNFHRAHQAVYLDRLFSNGQDLDWGIVGAGIKPPDVRMRDHLKTQDWLSSVIELDPRAYTARITGSMIGFADVSSRGLIDALCRPEIRIVSMTITEGGYYIDPVTGGFHLTHADVMFDSQNPESPRTVFGALVAALARRRETGLAPFTIMSCDNLPANGDVTRRAVIGTADLMRPDLVSWLNDTIAFPNGMVDCITPATSDRERAMALEKFGINDTGVVVCEPFRQWVLEDHFTEGRPALEDVGVEFVTDVGSYELMKLRILNGGHAAISYPSALLGVHYVHDAMAMPAIAGFLDKLETREIIPTLPPVAGVKFDAYLDQTKERFSNAEVADTISRLCFDGSNRQPKFIFPTLLERLDKGLPVQGLALEVALWCRYCAGEDENGRPIELEDQSAARLRARALEAKTNPLAFLSISDLFGPLSAYPVFAREFSSALELLWKEGVASTLESYVNG